VSITSKVTIKLFASLAETCGWRERVCDVPAGTSLRALWTQQTGLADLPPRVLCARNMDYCDADTQVEPGDEIAFFPPVTGGAQ
jgi:molybdopterin converting factor subunit 1